MPPKKSKKAEEAKDDGEKKEVKAEESANAEGAKESSDVKDKKEEKKEERKEKKKDEAKDDIKVAAKNDTEKDEAKPSGDDEKDKEKADSKKDDAKADEKEEETKEEETVGEKKSAKNEEKGTKRKKDEKESKKSGEAPSRESKRARKSANTFVPDDFTEKTHSVKIIAGRGDKLRDIPSVKKSIQDASVTSDEFESAWRFVFAQRGKISKAEAKNQLLDYCGYLPEIEDGKDDAKQEKEDEEVETKYSKKAYKLLKPQIVQLCDFFDVDRTPGPEAKVDKDVLIDRLLDFLSAPSVEYTNAYVKEHGKEQVEQTGEEKQAKNPTKGKLPTEAQLKRWVKAYVACHDMSKSTMKDAVRISSEKFGIDTTPMKKTLKLFLTEEC